MFRRKTDSLPSYVSPSGTWQDHTNTPYPSSPYEYTSYNYSTSSSSSMNFNMNMKKQTSSKKNKSHFFSYLRWIMGCIMIICFVIGIYLIKNYGVFSPYYSLDVVEMGSFLQSDFDVNDENETMEKTMDDIMMRHPYATFQNGGKEDLKYSSTIMRIHKKPREEDSYGNVVFFSFHGHVGSESIMHALHHQYGFQDGGNLDLDDIHAHTKTYEEEEWGKHDASINSERWQEDIAIRVEKSFQGYGARGFRRKIVHVRMIDAWTNDVSISWLMEALRDVGGVTHFVFLIRNPLRAKITDIANTKFKHIISPSIKCYEQKFLYEIDRSDAIEMAVSQHSGFREALSVERISSIGFTYEHDILPHHSGTMRAIASFLWDPNGGEMSEPSPIDWSFYQTQIGDCALEHMIYNFKELRCMFSETSLSWMVDSDNTYTFDKIMTQGDEFSKWSLERNSDAVKRKLLDPTLCRVVADQREVQDSTLAVRKHTRRCGHGGHTEICQGYGQMKSFMCSRLLALTNGRCDSFTYTNGNCYLHDETLPDFWEGDCESSTTSFLGYLRFPDDR